MVNNSPFVSIIIPCRNEEKFIGKCLDSILEQDYSKERIEILVVAGMSGDKTREIVKSRIDFQKIRKELGWRSEYDLDEGLKRTVEWFRANLKIARIY